MPDTTVRPWWDAYADLIPPPFLAHVAAEHAADAVWAYETHVVPGLLQTPAYARAVMAAAGDPPGVVGWGLRLRLRRQAVLDRPGVRVSTLVGEAVLRRPVGDGPEVMAAQLAALAAGRPGLVLRVLPTTARVPAVASHPFTVAAGPAGRHAYGETVHDAFLFRGADRPDVVDRYQSVFDGLWSAALGPAESAELIRGLM